MIDAARAVYKASDAQAETGHDATNGLANRAQLPRRYRDK
jgi:hypothetical protein